MPLPPVLCVAYAPEIDSEYSRGFVQRQVLDLGRPRDSFTPLLFAMDPIWYPRFRCLVIAILTIGLILSPAFIPALNSHQLFAALLIGFFFIVPVDQCACSLNVN